MKHNYSHPIGKNSNSHAPHFHITGHRNPWLRTGAAAILGGLLLAVLSGSVRAAEAYVADDPNDAKKEPPLGGGNGWLGGANAGLGATINAGQTIWIACRNAYQANSTKTWDLKLTSTALPGDINDIVPVDGSGVGFDKAGTPMRALVPVTTWDLKNGIEKIHMSFDPCPEWERVAIKNKSKFPLTFTIDAAHECIYPTVSANTMSVESLVFGAASGVIPTNQYISQIMLFPRTVALDFSAPPGFSAPPASGNWTIDPVFTDPDGTNHSLGGILFTSDDLGLDPSQSCAFSFAMQGPAADLQYTMYAYDEVAQDYQQFELDFRPSLAISTSNSSVGLEFNSTVGLDYVLESSTDFHTWQPRQTITGTGGTINSVTSMSGPVGFYRLRCFPSPIDTTPPGLSTVTAAAFSNSLTISFSEPVNSLTATNLADYYVGNNVGQITIQSVLEIWPRAVRLTLATALIPGGNYFLGISGVTDLSGNAIVPTTLPFTAATLQSPCPGGTLLVRQAYSECNPDGFWHVVEDDWYRCPGGSTQKFRVADTKTTRPCGAGQSAPSTPAGLLYPTAADVASTCQSPIYIGTVQICECVGGIWSISTYLKYQCLDGTIYLSGPVQNVPMNPPTACNQPPPPMPPPH